jgi:hypothetical protein
MWKKSAVAALLFFPTPSPKSISKVVTVGGAQDLDEFIAEWLHRINTKGTEGIMPLW